MFSFRFFQSALFVFLSCAAFFSVFAEENLLSAPTENTEISTPETQRTTNDALQQRSDALKKATEKSVEEKAVEKSTSDLENVKLEKEALLEINRVIENEMAELKKSMEASKNQQKIAETTAIEAEKTENITQLQKELERKNMILLQNQKAIEELSAVEELRQYTLSQNVQLKKELEEKKKAEWWEKGKLFFWITLFFLFLYAVRMTVSKKMGKNPKIRKKYAHFFNSIDVFLGFAYAIFLIWFLFHSNPSAIVYLIFLVGGLVVALQEFIFSFVASIVLLREYSVGDRILVGNKMGIIEKMSMLKVAVRRISEQGLNLDELIMISNSSFLKQDIIVMKKSNIEKCRFEIVLPDDLPLETPVLLERLQKEILEPLITVKTYDAINEKRIYFDIQYGFNHLANVFISIFWTENTTKNEIIKKKIWELVNQMRQEAIEKKKKS